LCFQENDVDEQTMDKMLDWNVRVKEQWEQLVIAHQEEIAINAARPDDPPRLEARDAMVWATIKNINELIGYCDPDDELKAALEELVQKLEICVTGNN
jgi:hypothetical protein